MSISDRTRKLLWGRSGNRCGICRHELIVDATPADDESVIGDECHILSTKVCGPRYDQSCPREKLDAYDNLILLCRTHHKMVDDQSETYTADILRWMKATHAVWVSAKLADAPAPKPITVRRVKENTPEFLTRLLTGQQVLNLVEGMHALSSFHDEVSSSEEAAIIGRLFDLMSDWADFGDEYSMSARLRSEMEVSDLIREIEEAGFLVFGGREVQVLEGGLLAASQDFPVTIIQVLRKDTPAVTRTGLDNQDLGAPKQAGDENAGQPA